jgi:hypothetical protein
MGQYTQCKDLNPYYSGGRLGCTDNCIYDTDACSIVQCGDGKVEGSEVCDGFDLGANTGKTCRDFIATAAARPI